MPTTCVIRGCLSKHTKGESTKFVLFPSEKHQSKRRALWIAAVNLANEVPGRQWKPSKGSRLCGKHFISGQPHKVSSHPDYVPSVFSNKGRSPLKKKIVRNEIRQCEENISIADRSGITERTNARSKESQLKGRKASCKKSQEDSPVVSEVSSAVNDESSVSSENSSQPPASDSMVTSPEPSNSVTSHRLETSESVPKESLAGQLVISNQSSKMPDPNSLLRLLKLPPNIMFKINATNQKLVKRVVSRPKTTNKVNTNVAKLTISLNKDPPVKPQSEMILPDRTQSVENSMDWIKKEPECMDSIAQEVLEPTVEMYFECDQQPMRDIKTEPVKDVDSTQEETMNLACSGPPNQAVEVNSESQEQSTMDTSTEPLNGDRDGSATPQAGQPVNCDSVRRSTRIRKKIV